MLYIKNILFCLWNILFININLCFLKNKRNILTNKKNIFILFKKKDNYNPIYNKFDKNINATYNLYLSKNNKYNNINNNSYIGCDTRIIQPEITLYNISMLFYKKKLFDILNDNNIGINNKIIYINNYNLMFNTKSMFDDLINEWNN